ncbi:MAG: hypothetical protein ACRD5Z_24750 [Bryobacteraceae bacterium]
MMQPLLFVLFLAAFVPVLKAESFLDEAQAERNPGKRSEIALELAGKSLDQARDYYVSGNRLKGDSELDMIDSLAAECLTSVEEARKSKYWKKAELKIAALMRRVNSLIGDLSYDQRGKAQELETHLNQVHDRLLAGVMAK